MDNWELLDSRGFEHLKLGDDRASIRARFGLYRTVRRWGTTETDQFLDLGFIVQYTTDDLASFIELSGPVLPTLKGIPLIGRPVAEVVEELRMGGMSISVVDEERLRINEWEVGIYAPDGIVEAMSVGNN